MRPPPPFAKIIPKKRKVTAMSDFLAHLRKPEVPDWLRVVYCLIFLVMFAHAVVTEGALTCCPLGYADLETFVQCAQAAAAWTAAAIALVEVTIYMVLLVPKAYNKIKDEGIAVGVERGRAEGVDDALAAAREAMRDAGVDDETRRRVEDDIARRSRNGS